MLRFIVSAAVAVLLCAAPAMANDSVAAMGAGGLVFQRTDGITMLSEDLFVSAREVRVKYRFRNHTDRDIETLVAFPMPDLTAANYTGDTSERAGGPFLPFITWVDDNAVQSQVEHKAMLGRTDVTGRLRAIGIPLEPHLERTMAALRALPAAAQAGLVGTGLIEVDSYDSPDGPQRWITPKWTLKTSYFWTQYFPAGVTVGIEHAYAPAIGGAAQSAVADHQAPIPGEMGTAFARRYCLDAPFMAAVRRGRASGARYSETWVDYILTTGANWSGPIGDFRLVVDKGDEANLVSFCGEDVRRIGPTQFEIRRRDFTPDRDLNVLILRGDRITQD